MKRYIILGWIMGLSGGPIYIDKKVDYLKKKGWIVDVYTGYWEKLYLPHLEEYQNNYYPELDHLPFWTTNKRQKDIICKIIGDEKFELTVIESAAYSYAVWGELIAKKIQAKHVFFNIQEDFPPYREWYYEFIDFKHKRKELAGIHPSSIQSMFREYKRIADSENYHLRFCCKNEISNANNAVMQGVPKADINFGCISRLEKGYIIPMFSNIVKLADRHPNLTFSIVMVGGTQDDAIVEQINKIVMPVSNLNLYHLGYVSPIPRALIDYVDVFIGTAGSAAMTADAGKITVSVDTATCQPLGILHYDTEELTFFRGDTKKTDLHLYLEKLVFEMDREGILKKLEDHANWYVDYMSEFDRHMEFIRKSCSEAEYFEFHNLRFWDKVKNYIIVLVGVEHCKKIKTMLKKIILEKK